MIDALQKIGIFTVALALAACAVKRPETPYVTALVTPELATRAEQFCDARIAKSVARFEALGMHRYAKRRHKNRSLCIAVQRQNAADLVRLNPSPEILQSCVEAGAGSDEIYGRGLGFIGLFKCAFGRHWTQTPPGLTRCEEIRYLSRGTRLGQISPIAYPELEYDLCMLRQAEFDNLQ